MPDYMDKRSNPAASQTLRHADDLLAKIVAAYKDLGINKRLIVGIAGAPASGKSTLAQNLVRQLNAESSIDTQSVVVPMDGYHLDNSVLDQRGHRAVKGAPHTFDALGFLHLLQRLAEPLTAAGAEDETDSDSAIYIPVFDRSMDLSRCAATAVENHHRIIVVEGNYLLLNKPIWCEIQCCLTLSVFLDVPVDVLEERLVKRWLDHGHTVDEARARALSNDIPNARTVTQESGGARFVLGGMRQ